jgi:hypothetical protein
VPIYLKNIKEAPSDNTDYIIRGKDNARPCGGRGTARSASAALGPVQAAASVLIIYSRPPTLRIGSDFVKTKRRNEDIMIIISITHLKYMFS